MTRGFEHGGPALAEMSMSNAAEDVRAEFLLRPDVTFLNHGSFGACPIPVFSAYQMWQLELEREPVEFLGRRYADLLRDVRTAVGTYLHAEPEDLMLVTNATTAVNMVAKSLQLGPDDEVLTTDHEYGGVDRVWQYICQERGARLVVQSLPPPLTSVDELVEHMWAAVTPQTKVLAMSHVTSPTGVCLPVGPLVKRAREAGILSVIDGAHAPAQIDLDLSVLGADFYAGNLHKWLCGPKGAAFLYARREVQHLVQPLVVSWGWRALPEWQGDSPFQSLLQWQGTQDISAWLAIPAAIAYQAARDWPAVRRRCHELAADAASEMTRLTGQPRLTSHDSWFAQMASVQLPPCDPFDVQRRLFDEHRVEVAVVPWNGRPLLRVSVQGYNTPADIEHLITALGAVLGL